MLGGLCSVCGKPTKNPQTCQLCGATVCEEHIKEGICVRCRSGKKLDSEKALQ